MRDPSIVNNDLKALKLFYANRSILEKVPALLSKSIEYEKVIAMASPKLASVYLLVYQYNNSYQVAAEELQVSLRTVNRLVSDLKDFLCNNL